MANPQTAAPVPWRPWTAGLLALALWALAAAPAHAARLALVIGNDSYTAVEALKNARADARAMARALESAGFRVELAFDQDRAGMNRLLRRFRQQLGGGDDAVFFYAGHGVEFAGSNYLLPVDIKADEEDQIRDDAIGLQEVLEGLQQRLPRFTLAIVDACRDNPMKGVGCNLGERGLKPVTAATGQMVIYSAGAGQKALDRLGEQDNSANGVFTRVFVEEMLKAEEPVQLTVARVRREVSRLAASVGRVQVPALYDQSVGEFQFVSGAAPGKREPARRKEKAPEAESVDLGDLEKWSKWQSQFKADFARVEGLGLKGRMAVEAWQRLLAAFGQNNPYSDEDDRLRAEAGRRLEAAKAEEAKPGALAAGSVFRDCPECPEMVVIPAGEFQMGSPAGEVGRAENEGPVHRVKVNAFALAKHEVTRGEFRRFVRETGRPVSGCWTEDGKEWKQDKARGWESSGYAQGDDHPVVCVSWEDAKAYAQWLSGKTGKVYRLASEAEWEYAARAGTRGVRYWGDGEREACGYANVADQATKRKYNWSSSFDCDDGYAETAPVGRYRENGFGLKDMLGNAWEWVEDCWNESYQGAPVDGSAWLSGNCARRVARGGAWSLKPSGVRSAFRKRFEAVDRDFYLGFRLARTLP